MYTAVAICPLLGADPYGSSLWLLKIVPDDFVATARFPLPTLTSFSKRLLEREADQIPGAIAVD